MGPVCSQHRVERCCEQAAGKEKVLGEPWGGGGGVWKGRRGLRELLFALGLGDIRAVWGQSASRTLT